MRIRWNQEEIDQVVYHAANALTESCDLFGKLEAIPKSVIEESLMKAQRALPLMRRKRAFSQSETGIFTKLEKMVRAKVRMMAKKKEESPVQMQELQAPAPAPVAEAAPVAANPTPSVQATTPSVLSLLGQALGEGFIIAISRAPAEALSVLQEVFGPSRESVPVPRPARHIHHDPALHHQRTNKPRVAVIGLLNGQRRAIEREMPQLDIRFLGNGEGASRVADVTANCDAAFVMTKFVSHQVERGIKARDHVRVNGGVTDLARIMRARYVTAIAA